MTIWHQDSSTLPFYKPDFLTLWIAIDDVDHGIDAAGVSVSVGLQIPAPSAMSPIVTTFLATAIEATRTLLSASTGPSTGVLTFKLWAPICAANVTDAALPQPTPLAWTNPLVANGKSTEFLLFSLTAPFAEATQRSRTRAMEHDRIRLIVRAYSRRSKSALRQA